MNAGGRYKNTSPSFRTFNASFLNAFEIPFLVEASIPEAILRTCSVYLDLDSVSLYVPMNWLVRCIWTRLSFEF